MADVKDILGVARGGGAAPSEAPGGGKGGKSGQPKLKRPKGMSREAFALMEGSNPILPTHMLELKKKKEPVRARPSGKGTVIFRLKRARTASSSCTG